MKRKLLLMGITAAMLLTTIIGGSLAFFQADGKPVQNQLSTKKLDIDLQEDGTWVKDADGEAVVANLMPGASVEKHVRVINDVPGDTSFYTRVRITRCWGEEREGQFSKDFTLDPSLILLDLNTTEQGGSWLLADGGTVQEQQGRETITLYYTKAVSGDPGSATDEVLKGFSIAPELSNAYADKAVQICVEADGVQTLHAEDAALSEWGVQLQIDNGTITAVWN